MVNKIENKQSCFFWLDLEMTGLDALHDRILELGVIITDAQLNVIDEYETALFQTPEVLKGMNEWCQKQHRKSGLLERVPKGRSESACDAKLCELVDQHYKNIPVILFGNSIHQDRTFINRYFINFSQKLHYRMMDVSSFKIIFNEMFEHVKEKPNRHRSLDDIRESIQELQYYLQFLSKPGYLSL